MELNQGTNEPTPCSCIDSSIQVILTLNGYPITCIVDTGAQSSMLMKALPGSPLRNAKGFFITADGRAIEMEGRQEVSVNLMGFEVLHTFNIFKKKVNAQYCKNLMGIDLLRKFPVMLLPGLRSLHIKIDGAVDGGQVKWHLIKCPGENECPNLQETEDLNECQIPEHFVPFVDIEERDRVDIILNTMQEKLFHLGEKTKLLVISNLNQYLAVFGLPFSRKEIPLQIKHEIKIKPGSQPLKNIHTEMPLHLKSMIQKQTVEMWFRGIIKPSSSTWSSPVSIIEMKSSDGRAPSFKICPDFRKLNEITLHNRLPLNNNIPEVLAILKGSMFFTKIDIHMGYQQIDILPSDREKTAFNVFGFNFEFVKMPLGIKNAAVTFQNAMNHLFSCCVGRICLILNDCLLIYSKDMQDHTIHVAYVLSVIQKSGLRANITKCDFYQNQFSYFGHTVTSGGVIIDQFDISDFPIPLSDYQVSSFLALGDCCKYTIPSYSKLKTDLASLHRENYIWSEKHEMAFNEIRTGMTANKLFATPSLDRPFRLVIFLSESGWGSILSQMKKKDRNISFVFNEFSRNQTMEPDETKQLFAVLWSMNYYRSYLLGRPFFLLVSSNKVKQILSDHQICAPWNSRLIKCITEYDFIVSSFSLLT